MSVIKIFLGALLSSSPAFSLEHTRFIEGAGERMAFCSRNSFFWCYQSVQQQAKKVALEQASTQCEEDHGTVSGGEPHCTESCEPSTPPATGSNFSVTCRVRCQSQCEPKS